MTLAGIVSQIISVINLLVALLGSVALAIFLWGGVRYLYESGDAKGRESQKALLGWGLLALFVLVSVFGILNFLQRALLPA